MHVLAAYAAVEPWVHGRRVVVLSPETTEGARRLAAAGARDVLAETPTRPVADDPPIGVRWLDLEGLRDVASGSVDLVLDLEGFAARSPADRRARMRMVRRMLGSEGALVVRAPADGSDLDFWTLESEMSASFGDVAMLAQIPWEGYSVTPVLDADEDAPALCLVESLLDEDPSPAFYLAVAAPNRLPSYVSLSCALVPVPGPDGAAVGQARDEQAKALAAALRARDEAVAAAQQAQEEHAAALASVEARVEALSQELAAARARAGALEQRAEALSDRAAAAAAEAEALRRDLAARTSELAEMERARAEKAQAVERLRGDLERDRADAEVLRRQLAEKRRETTRLSQALGAKTDELSEASRRLEQALVELRRVSAERDEVRRQLDVAVAEREGVRQLAERAEAEVELLRKRLAERERTLAEKIEEASRAQGEAAALRERLADDQRALRAAREAAPESGEQGRLLAEVAHDRDRLREELGRRNREIAALEEKLWAARDDVQRVQLESARLAVQLESARERLALAERAEAAKSEEASRLAAALREAELARAELSATLRAREETAARDVPPPAGPGDEDVETLRAKLADLDVKLRAAAEARAVAEASREEAQGRLSAAQAEHAELRARFEAASRDLAAKTSLVADLRESVELARAERAAAEARAVAAEEEVQQLRAALADAEADRRSLQGRLESAAVERAALERKLAARPAAAGEGDVPEKVRPYVTMPVDPSWPAEAQAAVAALQAAVRAGLAAAEGASATASGDRLQRELAYRATEQEHMLARLETAEQRIWEMSDAADRHAARLAASLAQLEQAKEQLDETREELQLTRSMLSAAQARIVEQERLLGSERAKLARAGIGPEGFARTPGEEGAVERVFYELNPELSGMTPMELRDSGEIAVPVPVQTDASSLPGTPGSGGGFGVVVETLDEPWEADDEGDDG